MFYKFGDNTKTKTVIKKGSEEEVDLQCEKEIFDENDDTNRRSAILKKYNEKELEQQKELEQKK